MIINDGTYFTAPVSSEAELGLQSKTNDISVLAASTTVINALQADSRSIISFTLPAECSFP